MHAALEKRAEREEQIEDLQREVEEYLPAKQHEYEEAKDRSTRVLARNGMTSKLTHTELCRLGTELRSRKEQLIPAEAELELYHDLPPVRTRYHCDEAMKNSY